MQRTAMQKLVRWKDAPDRKPLIIRGVRQVGKTWLMKTFAEKYFAGRSHYFNFDMDPGLCGFFEQSIDPARILESLQFKTGRKIEPDSLYLDYR